MVLRGATGTARGPEGGEESDGIGVAGEIWTFKGLPSAMAPLESTFGLVQNPKRVYAGAVGKEGGAHLSFWHACSASFLRSKTRRAMRSSFSFAVSSLTMKQKLVSPYAPNAVCRSDHLGQRSVHSTALARQSNQERRTYLYILGTCAEYETLDLDDEPLGLLLGERALALHVLPALLDLLPALLLGLLAALAFALQLLSLSLARHAPDAEPREDGIVGGRGGRGDRDRAGRARGERSERAK